MSWLRAWLPSIQIHCLPVPPSGPKPSRLLSTLVVSGNSVTTPGNAAIPEP